MGSELRFNRDFSTEGGIDASGRLYVVDHETGDLVYPNGERMSVDWTKLTRPDGTVAFVVDWRHLGEEIKRGDDEIARLCATKAARLQRDYTGEALAANSASVAAEPADDKLARIITLLERIDVRLADMARKLA